MKDTEREELESRETGRGGPGQSLRISGLCLIGQGVLEYLPVHTRPWVKHGYQPTPHSSTFRSALRKKENTCALASSRSLMLSVSGLSVSLNPAQECSRHEQVCLKVYRQRDEQARPHRQQKFGTTGWPVVSATWKAKARGTHKPKSWAGNVAQ